jgi:hypothetical protein
MDSALLRIFSDLHRERVSKLHTVFGKLDPLELTMKVHFD